jgi:hypothetical protein
MTTRWRRAAPLPASWPAWRRALEPGGAAFRADVVVVEAEIARLTSAIARAPDLGSLIDALRAKEQHRTALQAEVAALDGLGRVRTLDAATLTPAIVAKLGDWARLMGRTVGQARQILRHVLDGRITFTPQADGLVAFVGYADPGPLFAGTVLESLGKTVVSPRGAARTWTFRLTGRVTARRIAECRGLLAEPARQTSSRASIS